MASLCFDFLMTHVPFLSIKGTCILTYLVLNVFLTLQNKWVLSVLGFSFPWLLTFIHLGVSGFCSLIYLSIVSRSNPTQQNGNALSRDVFSFSYSQCIKVVLCSIIFTMNVAFSNISLNYVSIPFHQLAKSTGPFFIVVLEYLFFHKSPDLLIMIALIPVSNGM